MTTSEVLEQGDEVHAQVPVDKDVEGQPSMAVDDPSAADADDAGTGSLGQEAAKWRRQFREAEQRVSTLTQRVEALQTREVLALAADHLAEPADLFAFGGKLDGMLNDDGEVEPGLVETHLLALLSSRPGLAKRSPRTMPDLGGGKRGATTAPAASWSDVLGSRR